MEIAGWIVKAFVIFLGIQYLLGPIIVWWIQKLPEKYRFELIDSKIFLSERTPAFVVLHEEIQEREFEYIGSSELIMGNTSIYFSIYNNFNKKIACTLVTACSIPINTTHIEFTQIYKNGSVLNVSGFMGTTSVYRVSSKHLPATIFDCGCFRSYGQFQAGKR